MEILARSFTLHTFISREILALLIFAVIILVLHMITQKGKKLFRLPPSPFRLPLLGNIYLVRDKEQHKFFQRLAEQYGPVFTFWFGRQPIVIVNNIETAREALIKNADSFAGRPQGYTSMVYGRGFKGLMASDFSEGWKLRRKLSHTALKTYIDGKGNFEDIVSKECEYLVKRLHRYSETGESFYIQEEIALTVLNILCSFVFGKRYERDDLEFKKIIAMNHLAIEAFEAAMILDSFPFLRHLPLDQVQGIIKFPKLRDPFIEQEFNRHRETFDPDNIRDFTDALIKAEKDLMDTDGQNSNLKTEALSKEHQKMILADLLIAGSDTTATSIEWALLYYVAFQEKQKLIQKEFDNVLNGKKPKYSMKYDLPYFWASINEALRKSSVSQLGIPHRTTQDTVLHDFDVPNETVVIFNQYAIHHDENYWKDPDDFQPERFINEEGKFAIPNKSFLPFSAGRRVCPGEQLGKTELFVVLANLLSNFNFENAEDKPLDLEGQPGLTLTPKPFKVRVTSRQLLET